MHNIVSFIKRVWQKPIVRLSMSLLILGVLLVKLPLSDLWQTLKRISPGLWIFAVITFIAGHGIGVAKWRLLINTGKIKIPLPIAFRYYFAGLFANLFLPSIAGGDVVRAAMAIRFKGDKEAVILGSLLDRLLDISSLALFILAGAWFSPAALVAQDRGVLVGFFLILFVLALGVLLFLIIPLPKFVPKRLRELIVRFRQALRHLIQNPQRALAGLGMALLIQGTFVVLNAFLGSVVGIRLPLAVWFLAWPLAKLSATLPVSIGGLGVREVALSVFLGRFGVSMTSSVGLGLLWQTVVAAGSGVGGIFYSLTNQNVLHRDIQDAE
jgi:uncharacterized protein (TIRG00374 family)